jgi:alpha-tubulin suppressor-like RCC1 family protein
MRKRAPNSYTSSNAKWGDLNMKAVAVLVTLAVLAVPIAAGASLAPNSSGSTNSDVITWQIKGNPPSEMDVTGLPDNIDSIQASNYGGLALDANGNVWTWDTGSSAPEATQVKGPTQVVSVGEGASFGAGATSSGNLWVWGNDHQGELCNGEYTSKTIKPTLVSGVSDVTSVSGGGNHLIFLLGDGTVYACGTNGHGELGDGGKQHRSFTPVKVVHLHRVEAISAGQSESMALDASGNVWTWGFNELGQLGDGTTRDSDVPVKVSLPAPAVQIYAGGDDFENGSMIVLLSNGQVWAWGDDAQGQLGNGTDEASSDVPVQVIGLSGVTITAVATAGVTSFALDSTGDVWGWGGAVGATPEIVATGFTQISGVAGLFVGLQTAATASRRRL